MSCDVGEVTESLENEQNSYYGEFVLPYSTARRCYKLFKEARPSISKEGGPGAKVTALKEENINTAAIIGREDRRITLRSLSEILNISLGFTHTLVTEKLNMRRVCARWVPRLLMKLGYVILILRANSKALCGNPCHNQTPKNKSGFFCRERYGHLIFFILRWNGFPACRTCTHNSNWVFLQRCPESSAR